MNNTFSNLEVEPTLGAAIMESARITEEDLMEPKKIKKIQDIIKFFKNTENPRSVIRRIASGKLDDRLEHLWEWVQLNVAKNKIEDQTGAINDNKDEVTNIINKIENRKRMIDDTKQDLMDIIRDGNNLDTTKQKFEGLQQINNKLDKF